MPLAIASPGSITQWIAVCKCQSLSPGDEHTESEDSLPICGSCGKRISAGRAGSFTQWIFRTDLCACQVPAEMRPAAPAADQKPDDGSSVMEEELDPDEIEVESDRFPLDRYKPLQVLGKGALGTVYKCRDRQLNKLVAVKILQHITGAQLRQFQAEAREMSRLNHPGIVSVMDFGVTAGETPYMVLEYVESRTLASLLDERGHLELAEVCEIFSRIADALAHTHEKGIFHRDLKPGNILLSGNDIRIIDFTVTMPGQDAGSFDPAGIVCTPAYMAPDQFAGHSFDARSDIYSLGCMLFEALAGNLPYQGDTPIEVLSRHAAAEIPSLADFRPDLEEEPSARMEEIIRCCLAKDPEDRFDHVGELAAALQELAQTVTEGRTAPGANPGSPPAPVLKIVALSVMVIALLTGSVVFLTSVFLTKSGEKSGHDEKAPQALKPVDDLDGLDVRADWSAGDEVYSVGADNNTGAKFLRSTPAGLVAYKAASDELTDKDLQELADKDDLNILSLAGCAAMTGEGLCLLEGKPLTQLEIEWLHLSDEGLDCLTRLKSIQVLNASHIEMTPERIARLEELPSLTVLHLVACNMDAERVRALTKLRSLRTVTLDHNWKLKVEDLKPLNAMRLKVSAGSCPEITSLVRLKKALPDCYIEAGEYPSLE